MLTEAEAEAEAEAQRAEYLEIQLFRVTTVLLIKEIYGCKVLFF
jgi:hypothetical protein